MKILDRYVVVTFLKNYVISFLVLVGLYIILDMVFNLDEFVETQDKMAAAQDTVWFTLKNLADYYFYQTFVYFVYLSGIIPVVAAAFTLIRMTRFNELSAILSAGVPMLRIAAPMILVALVLNALLIVDQELLLPNMIPKLMREHSDVREAGSSAYMIRGMEDSQGGFVYAARFHPTAKSPYMDYPVVIRRDVKTMTCADRATWEPGAGPDGAGAWRLTNGATVPYATSEGGAPTPVPTEFYHSNIDPQEIQLYRSGDFVILLSTERINQLIDRQRTSGTTYGMATLMRVKHARFAQPIINVIMLLLGIAGVLTRSPQELKAAATKCVLWCGACLALSFLAYNMAEHPPAGFPWMDTWPALMAWMPIFLFGPLAVWLLDRVKT